MRNKHLTLGLFLSCLLVVIFLFPINGLCYGTGQAGHEGLAEKSIELKKSINPDLKDELEENRGENEEALRRATSAEDEYTSWQQFKKEIAPPYMRHFYDPNTERGLPPYFENAKQRAERFYINAADSYCSKKDKKKAWDDFGHAMHLLHDMGSPSHVRNAWHGLFQKFIPSWGFENYVSNNWTTLESQIVAQDCELEGGIGTYIDAMSSYTYLNYPKYDREYVKPGPSGLQYIIEPVTTGEDPYPDEPYNTVALLNEIVCYSAGLIDSFWNKVQNCSQKPPPTGPGGGHPDDNYEVSVPLKYDINEAEYQWLNMRLAMKKGRIGYYWAYLYGSKYGEIYNLPPDTTNEEITQKFVELTAIEDLLNNYPYNQTDDTKASPDVAVLSDGFSEDIVRLLFENKETARLIEPQFSPDELKNQPILVIPSGGLYGLENSDFFRASLDEYVKQGGTLIVFAQQHGYEFSALPVPQEDDGTYNTVTGYGWTEDQNCFANAAYIDTWHQILSGQSKSTPDLNLDGYFTDYPSSSTVILRRTANGQPAILMYDYGLGKVIVTSMYSDFAYSHSQASTDEIALVRDMVSWAKAPEMLLEIAPGDSVSVSMSVQNITSTDAASMKLYIYSPDRTTVVSEQVSGRSDSPRRLALRVSVPAENYGSRTPIIWFHRYFHRGGGNGWCRNSRCLS